MITLRRAVPADASALSAFAARTFSDTYAAHNTDANMRAYLATAYGEQQQSAELDEPGMITVLAESDDGIAGFAQVRRKTAPACVTQSKPVEIYRFYFDRRFHGTGAARQLMDEVLRAAQDLGAEHVWLGVWERNARAIAFYKKCGFRDIGTQQFQLGSDIQTDRVLIISQPGPPSKRRALKRVVRILLGVAYALFALSAWAQVVLALLNASDDPLLLTLWQTIIGSVAAAAAWGSWTAKGWAPRAAAAYGIITGVMIVALGPMLDLDSSARGGLWAGGAGVLVFGLGSAWLLRRVQPDE